MDTGMNLNVKSEVVTTKQITVTMDEPSARAVLEMVIEVYWIAETDKSYLILKKLKEELTEALSEL